MVALGGQLPSSQLFLDCKCMSFNILKDIIAMLIDININYLKYSILTYFLY